MSHTVESLKSSLKKCLIVLSGIPLTGKTVLGKKLAKILNLKMIDVDFIRKELDQSVKSAGKIKLLEQEAEKKVMSEAYTEMCRRAKKLIRRNFPVIICGTFSREEFK